MVCEKCKGGHYEEKIILCDRCDRGWHMFCLSPPLNNVPEGEWICPTCMAEGQTPEMAHVAHFAPQQFCLRPSPQEMHAASNSLGPYVRPGKQPFFFFFFFFSRPSSPPSPSAEFDAFQEGDTYSLEEFEHIASKFEKQTFGSEAKFKKVSGVAYVCVHTCCTPAQME